MQRARWQVQIAATQAVTRALRATGLRDPILRWRANRRRARRLARELRRDDSLSRPALHELDLKLYAIIARDDGFFIEAGAHDGFTQSNTYWLESFHGWRGLLVEPVPELAAEAKLSRPGATIMQCALVAADDPRKHLTMSFGDLFSMVKTARDEEWPGLGTVLGWRDPYELDVEARTLSSLLDEIAAPEVDLLSLDVEGFEGPALLGLDLTRHAPRYVLIEIHNTDRDKPPVDAALHNYYFEHSWLSPVDLLYVRCDVATASCPQAAIAV
jgi:FkbM family methyltransferase